MPGTPNTSQTDLSANANIGRTNLFIPVTLVTLTNAAQFQLMPGYAGRLTKMDFVTSQPSTGAGATALLTASIGGVDVTGGTVTPTLASTDTRNERTTGATITALNAFSATDTITITASAVTAFTAGSGTLQLTLVNDDTREAAAGASFGLRTGT